MKKNTATSSKPTPITEVSMAPALVKGQAIRPEQLTVSHADEPYVGYACEAAAELAQCVTAADLAGWLHKHYGKCTYKYTVRAAFVHFGLKFSAK